MGRLQKRVSAWAAVTRSSIEEILSRWQQWHAGWWTPLRRGLRQTRERFRDDSVRFEQHRAITVVCAGLGVCLVWWFTGQWVCATQPIWPALTIAAVWMLCGWPQTARRFLRSCVAFVWLVLFTPGLTIVLLLVLVIFQGWADQVPELFRGYLDGEQQGVRLATGPMSGLFLANATLVLFFNVLWVLYGYEISYSYRMNERRSHHDQLRFYHPWRHMFATLPSMAVGLMIIVTLYTPDKPTESRCRTPLEQFAEPLIALKRVYDQFPGTSKAMAVCAIVCWFVSAFEWRVWTLRRDHPLLDTIHRAVLLGWLPVTIALIAFSAESIGFPGTFVPDSFFYVLLFACVLISVFGAISIAVARRGWPIVAPVMIIGCYFWALGILNLNDHHILGQSGVGGNLGVAIFVFGSVRPRC